MKIREGTKAKGIKVKGNFPLDLTEHSAKHLICFFMNGFFEVRRWLKDNLAINVFLHAI